MVWDCRPRPPVAAPAPPWLPPLVPGAVTSRRGRAPPSSRNRLQPLSKLCGSNMCPLPTIVPSAFSRNYVIGFSQLLDT
ncbi:uncharacterized protein LOC110341266 [Mesocricetus auratus]|uniref:Uncharacterized protein LOC110341266 n=1 Tax=Mesocricetus auratus TaxID=10036 RepID=A0ABM2W380_MESAU|nr:uncharacterized protein LOC110341266 [Mesocricetus auratus]